MVKRNLGRLGEVDGRPGARMELLLAARGAVLEVEVWIGRELPPETNAGAWAVTGVLAEVDDEPEDTTVTWAGEG